MVEPAGMVRHPRIYPNPNEEPIMPRASTPPEIVLALSPSATARALGVNYERVILPAIDAGLLTVRMCGPKRRISVANIQAWFETWPQATKRKRKVPDNGNE
jgi:hypothetical protein